MSKKQILKNIQKDRKNTSQKEEKDNYFKFITTLALLLIVFIVSYFLIGLFYTNEISFNKEEDETKEEVNIDNNTIMIGQMFELSEREYYVLVYDMSDEDSSITSWESAYSSKDDALKVFKVDSSKKFNSKYIVKNGGNKSATSLSDLKVVSPTLIKIENKKITEYIEGEDNIINTLKGN